MGEVEGALSNEGGSEPCGWVGPVIDDRSLRGNKFTEVWKQLDRNCSNQLSKCFFKYPENVQF